MKKKSTKFGKMLITSLVSIALCVFMLAGTTWAWFTDSVTNAGNRIESGTLKIDAYACPQGEDGRDGGEAYFYTNPITGDDMAMAIFYEEDMIDLRTSTEPVINDTNWEPGQSNIKMIKVKNRGTLPARVKISFEILEDGLAGALWYSADNSQAYGMETLSSYEFETTLPAAGAGVPDGATEDSLYFLYGMYAEAGNQYQGKSFSARIVIRATQVSEEAVYPPIDPIDTALTDTVAPDTETVLESVGTPVKATIPANALPEGTQVTLSVVTESATADSVVYDISLTDAAGTALSPTEKIRIELNIGKGLSGFSVKHNGIPMAEEDYSYDNATGILTIETSSFSPFEVSFVRSAAATVNGTAYATLDEAFAAAKQNEVIYLWQDAALTADVETGAQILIPSTAAVTFDLAGKKLTSTYAGISVANYGTLTIKDSIGNGILHNISAEVGDNYSHDAVRNFGTLTINGGTFGDSDTDKTNANTEHRGAAVRNMPGAVCEINGGFFTCGDNYYTWGEGTGFSYAIRSSGELTINGATLYGAMNGGVSADAGNITINGGDFSVTGTTSFYVLVTNKSGGGNITVNGGTFTKTGGNGGLLGGFSGMPSWDASEELAANGFTITGGTFDRDGAVKTYRRVSNAEEFVSAVSAANADDVIVLANKIALTSQVAVSKPLSFVGLAGSGISGAPIRVAENVSASFRNVAFSSPKNAKNNASCVYGGGLAKLVFKDCTFTDTQWDSIQFIPAAGAEIVIDGCTFTNSVAGYRFIHIEAELNSNADVKVTVTNNTFGSSEKTTMSIIDIDYVNFAGITANGNTFADENGDIYICGDSVARTITSAEAYVMFKAQA